MSDAPPADRCAGPTGAGIPPNPCTEPGSQLRCQLCPKSPTYWRRGAEGSDEVMDQ